MPTEKRHESEAQRKTWAGMRRNFEPSWESFSAGNMRDAHIAGYLALLWAVKKGRMK